MGSRMLLVLFIFCLSVPIHSAHASFGDYCTRLLVATFSSKSKVVPPADNFNSYILRLARDSKARSLGFPTLQTEFHRDTLNSLIQHSDQYSKDSSKDAARRKLAEALKDKLTELSSAPNLDRIEFLATAKLFSVLFTEFDPTHISISLLNKSDMDLQISEQASETWSLWLYKNMNQGRDFSVLLEQIRSFTKNTQVEGQLRFPNHQINEVEDFEVLWDEDVAPILTRPGVELIDNVPMSPIAKAIHDEVHAHKIRNTDSRRLAARSGEKIRELIKNTQDPKLKIGLRLMYWIFSHELNVPVHQVKELGRTPSIILDNGPVHGAHIISYGQQVLRQGVFGTGYNHIQISDISNRGYEAFVTAYLNMEFLP